MKDNEILDQARTLIRTEGEVVAELAARMDDAFVDAVRLVAECSGVIMTTGSGTSGMMARRMAHLLSTMGMHAFFVPAADALHGPSACVQPGDVLIALSKAGRSAEINHFATVALERGAKVICMTWEPDSELGRLSDIILNVRTDVRGEGDGVFPFASTLAKGAMGDALCLMAKNLRGFDNATLAQTHPSGATADLVRK